MVELLLWGLYLQLPVVCGGVWHMVIVRRDCLPLLRRPICLPLFGANKTWRGLLLVPPLTALGALLLWPLEYLFVALNWSSPLADTSLLLAGAAAGLGYMLGELPNSLLKRRLGIAPGATPARHGRWFLWLDQLDSGIGAALAYGLYPGIGWALALSYAITFPLTALLVKRALFHAGLKSRPA